MKKLDAHNHVFLSGRRGKNDWADVDALIEAEVDGEKLTREEVLGFFQLLVVGGQETTTNLINNAAKFSQQILDAWAEIKKKRKTTS